MLKELTNPDKSEDNDSVNSDVAEIVSDVLSGPVKHSPQTPSPAESTKPPKIEGVVIGRIHSVDPVLVDYSANPDQQPLMAIATCAISNKHLNRDVALAFETGDPGKPIILGLIENPHTESTPEMYVENRRVELDGERMTLSAQYEIVLKCGKSSITLTKEGKILLRGKYLLSRSSGVNRIKGGSVQIN